MHRDIYFDNNASSRPLDSVIKSVMDTMTGSFGNPASAHGRGRAARHLLMEARTRVASLIGCDPSQIVFNSGATEGNNTVLQIARNAAGLQRLVVSAIEHPSVLSPAATLANEGIDVIPIPVSRHGIVDLDRLREAVQDGSCLVSIQWANSETGTIQPIAEVASLCTKHGAALHVDASQAVGRLTIDLATLPIDYLTFSGHKLHAPPGTGVLFVRQPDRFYPLLFGGNQERSMRAGTENVPAIVGFGIACAERQNRFAEAVTHMNDLRDHFERRLLAEIDGVQVNGFSGPRVCNTSNLRFEHVDGQALLAQLDRQGICCSQASACSSNRPEPSHVLMAMGLSEDEAFSSLRFSFSVLNTRDEVDKAIAAIKQAVGRLRALTIF